MSRMMWTVIVPVKPPAIGKSRLGADPALAAAIALDTIDAALAASRVDRVLVVTADASMPTDAELVLEPAPSGLGPAIAEGLRVAGDEVPRAVLLGDLPSLRSADLDEALRRAGAVPSAFVADREGTGTTMVTAGAGVQFRHAFGPDSASAHRRLALAELTLPADSTVPLDVDTRAHLAATPGLGVRTRAVLGRLSAA